MIQEIEKLKQENDILKKKVEELSEKLKNKQLHINATNKYWKKKVYNLINQNKKQSL